MSKVLHELITAMRARGATSEEIGRAAAEHSAREAEEALDRRRKQDAERQRRRRARRVTQESRDCHVTSRDTSVTPPSQQESLTSSSQEVSKNDDAETRARADMLADQVFDILGIDRQFVPPGWCGLAQRLEAHLRGGAKPELIRLAAQVVAKKKRGRLPQSARYLDPVIDEQHALAAPVIHTEAHNGQRELTLLRRIDSNAGNAASQLAQRLKRAAEGS